MRECVKCGRLATLKRIRGYELCDSCAEAAIHAMLEGHAPGHCYRCNRKATERTLINGGGIRDVCKRCLKEMIP